MSPNVKISNQNFLNSRDRPAPRGKRIQVDSVVLALCVVLVRKWRHCRIPSIVTWRRQKWKFRRDGVVGLESRGKMPFENNWMTSLRGHVLKSGWKRCFGFYTLFYLYFFEFEFVLLSILIKIYQHQGRHVIIIISFYFRFFCLWY